MGSPETRSRAGFRELLHARQTPPRGAETRPCLRHRVFSASPLLRPLAPSRTTTPIAARARTTRCRPPDGPLR